MNSGPLFLAFTIMASVLLFGSVEPWAASLAGMAITVYFCFFFIGRGGGSLWGEEGGGRGEKARLRYGWTASWRGWMCASAAGFIAVVLFELCPLPGRAVAFFSKKGYSLMEALSPGRPAWLCLSLDSHETMEALLRLLVCLMAFIIAWRTGRDRRAVKRAFSALCFFGFGLAIFAVIQKSTWNGRLYWFRAISAGHPFGPFVNRNHFAGFMGMLVPPGLGLALEARRPGKTALYALMAAVMAAGIFFSLSRGGVASFFVSMLVFLAASAEKKRGNPGGRTLYYTGFSVLFFLATLLFYVLYGGVPPLVERFAEGGLSFGTRLKVWEASLRAARDFRWFGAGLGCFREIFPLYNPDLQKTFDFAHNDYINLLVETGMAGSFFAAVFFASFARGVYNYFYRGRNRNSSRLTAGLLASVAYMLVHSFLDFNLHIPSNAITFAAIAGFATARLGAGEGGRAEGTDINGKRVC